MGVHYIAFARIDNTASAKEGEESVKTEENALESRREINYPWGVGLLLNAMESATNKEDARFQRRDRLYPIFIAQETREKDVARRT